LRAQFYGMVDLFLARPAGLGRKPPFYKPRNELFEPLWVAGNLRCELAEDNGDEF